MAGQFPRAANLLWKSAPAVLLIVLALPFVAQELQRGDEQPAAPIAVPGKPVSADSGKLAEPNIQLLKTQPPQRQMQILLESAINPDKGATTLSSESIASSRVK